MSIYQINPKPPSITAGVDSALAAFISTESDDDWQAHASCASVANAGDLFFSEELQDIAAAKYICAECPVIAQCLESAIGRSEPWGVWGGQLFLNGRILANKRRRGRPRKIPRPEDQVPDLPIPVHLQKLIAS